MTYVINFISRNKDNTEIKGFKPRSKNFLTEDFPSEELNEKFEDFIKKGVDGEFSRFYVSINRVDEIKVKKELAKFLIDEAITPTNWKLEQIENKIVSLASKVENKLEKKWLFDCDTDLNTTLAFIKEIPAEVEYTMHRTPHGFAVITSRGFDTREILKKHPDIDLKKDAPLCYKWGFKGER